MHFKSKWERETVINIIETKITWILFTVAQLEIQQHVYLAGNVHKHTHTHKQHQHKHMLGKVNECLFWKNFNQVKFSVSYLKQYLRW